MRIAVSGTANMGKSTFISDVVNKHPEYQSPKSTYRNIILDNKLKINKEANVIGQSMIFNKLVEELLLTNKDDNIIFDRCVFDAYIYSQWSYFNNPNTDIDSTFLTLQLEMAKYYSYLYDAVIFIPMAMDGSDPVIIKDDFRDVDESYRIEVDELFNQLYSKLIIDDIDFAKKLIYVNGSRKGRVEIFEDILNYSVDNPDV